VLGGVAAGDGVVPGVVPGVAGVVAGDSPRRMGRGDSRNPSQLPRRRMMGFALLYPSYSGNGGKRMEECGLPVDR
jgi:hypothetical protein